MSALVCEACRGTGAVRYACRDCRKTHDYCALCSRDRWDAAADPARTFCGRDREPDVSLAVRLSDRPPCEGCGAEDHATARTRPLYCQTCAGHWLCPGCDGEVRRMAQGRPRDTFCEVVDGWRMESELVGAERSCRVCGRPGRAPQWACPPCGGEHRVCRPCMERYPTATAGECALAVRDRLTRPL